MKTQEFSESRYARWRRVALAAAKQSGNNFLVDFLPAADFDRLLAQAGQWDLSLVCHTGRHCPHLGEVLDKANEPQKVFLAVGPEGGFSDMEISSAQKAGCLVTGLAAPVLRVETAAVYALSALCHRFDRRVDILR